MKPTTSCQPQPSRLPSDGCISRRVFAPECQLDGRRLRTLSAYSTAKVTPHQDDTFGVNEGPHGKKQVDADATLGRTLFVSMNTNHGVLQPTWRLWDRHLDTTHSMAQKSSLHGTLSCLEVEGISKVPRFPRMAVPLSVSEWEHHVKLLRDDRLVYEPPS